MNDKLIYNGWLKLYHRDVNGKQYDIIKNYDAVSAVIINEFNEILLVKQFRPSVMDNTLEIPSGCIDIPGESIENCLIREIQEETNLYISIDSLEKIVAYKPMMGFSNSTMYLFKAIAKKSSLKSNKVNDDDVTEVIWMPFDEFEKNIQNGKIYDSKTIMSYLYLKANL
jgi:ADP-ribose pyrophosphatase